MYNKTLSKHFATMRVGNNIREARERKKWSQEYMAEMLGLSVNGYGKIERNEVDVNIERLQSIAGILEVRAEDLIQNSVVFNNIGNNYNIYSTIYQQQSTKIEKLYEEQISLLKGKIQDLENKIQSLVNQ